MKLKGVLPFARTLLQEVVQPGDTVVDATAGNGHDTLFLATLVGDTGMVISCDIQADAIQATAERLSQANMVERVELHQIGHEQLRHVSAFKSTAIKAAVFNLGYLPKGDKRITTKGDTTIEAIKQIYCQLTNEGRIVLVIYHGHPEGKVEKDAVLDFTRSFPQEEAHVAMYQFVNQRNNPPFVVVIEKRK
ncbi:class I SAM-dependent methyltransferase [Shouchella lehensis]|uniref:Methyltransferase domain-containing protein n=1 Tax=Shouchella lehensis TaxID=300825 RepID=A0A4Y7WRB2_9BACI|nr:class I SAM-dependent methyltransferase [Shouchella lehensis]MBG9783850.1 rRNA methyltransferase [Shouchella lehensis]TES51186.1 methyltransferase domain-containing protein [Shouchella lehensis]